MEIKYTKKDNKILMIIETKNEQEMEKVEKDIQFIALATERKPKNNGDIEK